MLFVTGKGKIHLKGMLKKKCSDSYQSVILSRNVKLKRNKVLKFSVKENANLFAPSIT